MTIKIALCGKMRSGKDSVANLLTNEKQFKSLAFSDGIYKTIELLFPMQYDGVGFSKPRKLLQNLGQAVRTVDKDVWVRYLRNNVYKAISEDYEGIIVTDVRQPNEYQTLLDMGFHIIKVEASLATRIERAQSAGDDFIAADFMHETESHVDDFIADFTIENEGTYDNLRDQVETIKQRIRAI